MSPSQDNPNHSTNEDEPPNAEGDPVTEHPYRSPIKDGAIDAIPQIHQTKAFLAPVEENDAMDLDEEINSLDFIFGPQDILEKAVLSEHARISFRHDERAARLLPVRCNAVSKVLDRWLTKLKADRKAAAAYIVSTTKNHKRLYQMQQDLWHNAQLKDEMIMSVKIDNENSSSVLTPYVSISEGSWT